MHQYPLLTYDMWHFGYSKDKDSDFGEDDSSGVRMQPDHFPNVARPGGGYHKDTIVESDKPPVFCNKCDDEMVDGSCLRCDWGEKNRAVPTPNYPLDPFADDKAGIRAGSWKFGMARPALTPELIYQNSITEGTTLYNNLHNENLSLIEGTIGENGTKSKGLSRFKAKANCGICNQEVDIQNLGVPRCSICKAIGAATKVTPELIWQKIQDKNSNLYKKLLNEQLVIDSPESIFKRETRAKGLEGFSAKAKCQKCDQEITITDLSRPKCVNCSRSKKDEALTPELIYQNSITEGTDFYNSLHNENKNLTLIEGTIKEKENIPDDRRGLSRFEAQAECGNCNNIVNVAMLNKPRCTICSSSTNRAKSINQERINAINEYLQNISSDPKKPDWYVKWDEIQEYVAENGRKNFASSSVPLVHNQCGEEQYFTISTIENWIKQNQIPPCSNQNCENYDSSRQKYNPKDPGYIYTFQYNDTIVVGITNRWEGSGGREEKYKEVHRQKTKGTQFILDPTDFSKTDIQYHSPKNGDLRVPSSKELKARGLRPLDRQSTDETGLISIPQRLRWFTDQRLEYIKGPEGRRYRDRAKRRQQKERTAQTNKFIKRNVPDNAHVFGPIENGYIPQNIENAILKFWSSLNITPKLNDQTYTESIEISAEPSTASVNELDVGPDLTLDFHVFLIQQMIENGGHMEKLSEVLSPEDQTALYGFFDNDSDKINAALGVTWDEDSGENGRYVPGNELGSALGVSKPYIPADKWSFEEIDPQIQNEEIQTQRARQLSEDQQRALEAPALSPRFNIGDMYGEQRFQEELAKHPEWAETPLPEIEIPNASHIPRGEAASFEGIYPNQPFKDPNGDIRMIDDNNHQWIVYNKQWVRVAKMQWDFKTANEWDGFDDQAAGDLEGWSTQETKDVYDIFHNRSKNAEREELRDLFQFENYQTMPSENGKLSLKEFTEFLLKNIVAPYNQFLIGMKANHILSEEKVDWPSLYKVIEQEAIAEEEQFHDELHHLEGHTPQEHRLCPICNKPPEPDNPDAPGDTTIPPEWSGF